MAVKHFLVNPYKGETDKETINLLREKGELFIKQWDESVSVAKKQKIEEEDNLTYVHDRIIVKADIDFKNSHKFSNGLVIRRERKFNEFNRRITEPVNVIVISGENIQKGAEILVDHNALHETNRIYDYKNSFENEGSDKIRYFSIPITECYAWRVGKESWKPMPTFEFALRVFEPYKGVIAGIEPKQLKDMLYVTGGELKGKVVKTLVACDYQIIFQGDDGREDCLIRFRPFGDPVRKMEEEAIAILHDETDKVNKGKLLVGYSIKDAKQIGQSHSI
jgi:hypothetical protein